MNYKKYLSVQLIAAFCSTMVFSMQSSLEKNKEMIAVYLNNRSQGSQEPTVNGYPIFVSTDDRVISIYGEERPCGQVATTLHDENNKQIADSTYSIYTKGLDEQSVVSDIIQQINIKKDVLRNLLKDKLVVIIIETLWVDQDKRLQGTGIKFFRHNGIYFAQRFPKNCLLLGRATSYGSFDTIPQSVLNEFYNKCQCTVLPEEYKVNKNKKGQPFYLELSKDEFNKPCWMVLSPFQQNYYTDIKIKYLNN